MSTATATPVEPLLYKPAEAAKVLAVGRSTVYELMADGSLAYIKMRGSRRIRRTDLERFVSALPSISH